MSTVVVTTTAPTIEAQAFRGHTLRRFLSNRLAGAAALFLLLLIVLALFAPWIAPFDPDRQDLTARFQSPNSEHWLGTDELGRDQLSRLVFGARVSILAALEVVAVSCAIGVPLGMAAAYVGGWVETFLNWLMDALMSVPGLILALTVIATIGRGLGKAMLVIGILTVPRLFRLARAVTHDVKEESFVEAAIAVGCRRRRVVVQHLLPNVIPAVVVQIAVIAGAAVVAEATLSLLGLGVEPGTSSWGGMLSSGAGNMRQASFLIWGPGIAIMATVLAFTMVGDGLSKALSTRRMPGAGAT